MIPARRDELAGQWRMSGDNLDAFADRCRADGCDDVAADAEQAATEYRIAADELELGLLP